MYDDTSTPWEIKVFRRFVYTFVSAILAITLSTACAGGDYDSSGMLDDEASSSNTTAPQASNATVASAAATPSTDPDFVLVPWGGDPASFATVSVGMMLDAINEQTIINKTAVKVEIVPIGSMMTCPDRNQTIDGSSANAMVVWCADTSKIYVPEQALRDRAATADSGALRADMFIMLGVGDFLLSSKGWSIKPGFTACAAGYIAKTMKESDKKLLTDNQVVVMKTALPIVQGVDMASWFGKGYYNGLQTCKQN
ncbi:MAG: hypothetical protein PVI21_05795 [Candidatus Woesebacteria bacterium]|jgi:hypothetical protein